MFLRTFANARAFAERSHNCHTVPGISDKCARVCELSGPAPRRSPLCRRINATLLHFKRLQATLIRNGEPREGSAARRGPREGSASFRRVHAFVRDVQ